MEHSLLSDFQSKDTSENSTVNPPTIMVTTSSIIKFYSKSPPPYCALSNFSPHPICMPMTEKSDDDLVCFPTVEHYFQACKFWPAQQDVFRRIVSCTTPANAKKAGRTIRMQKKNWDQERLAVMERALRAKIKQHPIVREILLSTGDAVLQEDTDDPFWGGASNRLGRLWMQIRDRCRTIDTLKITSL